MFRSGRRRYGSKVYTRRTVVLKGNSIVSKLGVGDSKLGMFVVRYE
jgi:hypothetical protein